MENIEKYCDHNNIVMRKLLSRQSSQTSKECH